MKKLVFLLAFVSTMFMVSCEKDDIEPNNTNPTSVVDLVVEVTHVDVTSFGGDDGTITVKVTSGNPPYEFILDGVTKSTNSDDSFTFDNLTTDTYEVKVKDKENKNYTDSITINQPDETFDDLVLEYTVVDNEYDNNSGIIDLDVSGGKEPYMFKLNDGNFVSNNIFNNLGGGTYSVTVKDDRGVEFTKDSINVMYGFDISCNVLHSNTHTDDGGKITINPNVTESGNSPYKFSIDNENWVDDNVFDNLTPNTYTVYAKDKFGTVRNTDVVVENQYTGYRVGDLYNKDGYEGVVFKVVGDNPNDDILIADTQNENFNMTLNHYVAYIQIMNENGLNWQTMDIETLEMYLGVAKDFINDGNVFNVEVYVDAYSQMHRYWSTTHGSSYISRRVSSIIELENGNYVVSDYDTEFIDINEDMRGRYVATRPNSK